MTTLDQPATAGLDRRDGDGIGTRRTAPARRPAARAGVWRMGLLAAVLAAAANVLLLAAARALGVSFVMPLQLFSDAPPVVLPVEMVILGSVIGAVGGTAACAVLGRFDRRHPRLFVIVSLVVLVLSFATPLALDRTDGATKASLILMHIVAGLTTIGLLSGPRRR